MSKLGANEFNRIWKRSLRLLKKAYESNNNHNHQKNNNDDHHCLKKAEIGVGDCSLTFHTKVYQDILLSS